MKFLPLVLVMVVVCFLLLTSPQAQDVKQPTIVDNRIIVRVIPMKYADAALFSLMFGGFVIQSNYNGNNTNSSMGSSSNSEHSGIVPNRSRGY